MGEADLELEWSVTSFLWRLVTVDCEGVKQMIIQVVTFDRIFLRQSL
jgi:hypothetical protein